MLKAEIQTRDRLIEEAKKIDLSQIDFCRFLASKVFRTLCAHYFPDANPWEQKKRYYGAQPSR